MATDQICPICTAQVEVSARYPNYVCHECYTLAVDEYGRSLKFSNVSFSGGFIARYADTGEERDNHICYIDGIKCWADEAHMGGTIIRHYDDRYK